VNEPRRGIKSYVLRAGRITAAQKRALEDLMPRFGLPFAGKPLDLDAAFGRRAPRVLEIGFGNGDTLVEIAAKAPGTDFIGAEVHPPGVGHCLLAIEAAGLTNVRVVEHDAVEVLREGLAPASLDEVLLYFPDPWPKKRHHKRRLLKPAFVHALALRLAPGGYLHVATDWEDYAQDILATLAAEPLLANTAADFAPRPAHRPLTKFEARGLKLGHGVWDLLFSRAS